MVGTRKKRTREKETRVSPSRAPVLSFAHFFQAPATQAKLSKIPATYKPRKTVQNAHKLSCVGLELFCAINLAKEKTDNFHLAICRRRSFNYNYVLQGLLSCSNYVLLFRHSS